MREQEKEAAWGFLLWGGAGIRVLIHREGLARFPSPRLPEKLSQMWHIGEEREVRLQRSRQSDIIRWSQLFITVLNCEDDSRTHWVTI